MTTPARRPSLFGPLVWWELVRLARRGHAARVRVLLLYALLLGFVGFGAVWSLWLYPSGPARLFLGSPDALPLARAAEFARSLTLFLLEAQLLLVAVVTPAYAVAAVAEEKDRHTLSLLLTTELTDREIVWGKVAARVLLVLSAVAAGVPVLFLTLLFGEPDFQFLAAGYALAAGTAVLCVAIGVSAACHAPDSRTALIRAYAQSAALVGALLVPPFVLFSPFAMLLYCRMDFASESLRVMFGFGYPAGQVVIAWVLMVEATRNLRRAGPMAGPPEPTAFPEPPRGRPLPVLLTPPAEPIVLPPIGRIDPVLWKERHTGRPSPRSALDTPARCLGAFIGLLAVALFVTGGWGMLKRALRAFDPHEAARLERRGPGPPDRAPAALVAAGVLAAGLCLVPLAVGVTGCVAGERQRATLESLLATTLGRRRLLWSKVRAHVERTLVFAVGAIAALGSGFGVDGGWRFGLAAAAAFAGGLVLVLGYGAWLSVRCETPARAFRLCLPAVALTVALPVIVWSFTEWTDTAPPTRVLAYVAAASAVVGGLFLWRAGAELESGE